MKLCSKIPLKWKILHVSCHRYTKIHNPFIHVNNPVLFGRFNADILVENIVQTTYSDKFFVSPLEGVFYAEWHTVHRRNDHAYMR